MSVRLFRKQYHAPKCAYCREKFSDGNFQYYNEPMLSYFKFCEKCRPIIEHLPDFDPNGTKEKGPTIWRVAFLLCLARDDHKCRICGDYHVEVHHIIPRKDGGTHNLKNLITLCERHHKETFANGYAGLQIMDRLVQIGLQSTLE